MGVGEAGGRNKGWMLVSSCSWYPLVTRMDAAVNAVPLVLGSCLTLWWVTQGVFPAVLVPFPMGTTWIRAKFGLWNPLIPTWVAESWLTGGGPPSFILIVEHNCWGTFLWCSFVGYTWLWPFHKVNNILKQWWGSLWWIWYMESSASISKPSLLQACAPLNWRCSDISWDCAASPRKTRRGPNLSSDPLILRGGRVYSQCETTRICFSVDMLWHVFLTWSWPVIWALSVSVSHENIKTSLSLRLYSLLSGRG